MKSNWIALALAGCAAVGGLTYAFLQYEKPTEQADAVESSIQPDSTLTVVKETPDQPVHVDDLFENLENHSGRISLQGVVAGSDADKGVFGVIDLREYEECGVLSCAKFTMPVRFSGDLPEAKTILTMTGEVVKTSDGYLFDAQELVENP